MFNFITAIELRDRYAAGVRKFERSQLENADLAKACLSQINLQQANINHANLQEANLSYANFQRSSLVKANLSAANLSRADFSNTDLSKANLTGANLYLTSFYQADLNLANLSLIILNPQSPQDSDSASSAKVDFRHANLQGAFFIGVDLEPANLEGAVYGNDTRFPANFEPTSKGMVHIEAISKTSLAELINKFNHIYKYSSRYLGDAIATKYFNSSRPELDWLNQFQIRESQIVFTGTAARFVTVEQLTAFQAWTASYTKHCSAIIKNFSTLIQSEK